jgi:hypothetical protein
MLVWTIQPVEVYEKLKQEQVLYTDISLSSCYNLDDEVAEEARQDGIELPLDRKSTFKKGYDWLVKRMEEKIGRPEQAKFPWWAWYKRNLSHMKPDLRESGYGERGRKCVCLELEIPDDSVVLSDFDLWWYCISDIWYNNAHNEKESDELDDWYDSLSREEQEKLKLESWDTVFDTHFDPRPWYERGKWVQATFWELRLEQVRKLWYFTCK